MHVTWNSFTTAVEVKCLTRGFFLSIWFGSINTEERRCDRMYFSTRNTNITAAVDFKRQKGNMRGSQRNIRGPLNVKNVGGGTGPLVEANDHLASGAVNAEQIVLVEPHPNDRTSQEEAQWSGAPENTIHHSKVVNKRKCTSSFGSFSLMQTGSVSLAKICFQ